jgi:uncharacterized damage-inducible protein DinB
MSHDLQNTISLLARAPATFTALLDGLPDFWTLQNEGEGTWNTSQVIAHLAYCERTDWMTRTRILLDFGETRPFDPFDREGHLQECTGKSLGDVLQEFARLRAANLGELEGLQLGPEAMLLRGKHPAFGSVTLSELLAAWAVHDLTHLHQISRILARQYSDAVGPWQRYLGVLHCAGHSQSA